ncbi:MAG: DUF938 domain-containing protein [Nodosilinea sp.]
MTCAGRDDRCYAPATQRNREPILTVLSRLLPQAPGSILEIASGTGEHAVFLAPRLAPRLWLPSDPDPTARQSIAAWRQSQPAANLLAPLAVDVSQPDWWLALPEFSPALQAIVAINLLHIAPWQACLGLMAGARTLLSRGGILYLYGPFWQQDQPTAPSNIAFDEYLKAQNPEWGLRSLETVITVAQPLRLVEIIAMPANNLSVILRLP